MLVVVLDKMKTISKEEFLEEKEFYLNEIRSGKVFIYPTDTIYGIGCIGAHSNSIEKIREIKQRSGKPFSIIVPSKDWIEENCELREDKKEQLSKLPGKFTFIIKLKNKNIVAKESLIRDFEAIGVRIPDNWFAEFIGENDLTFVTTSVNVSGEPSLLKKEDLKKEIEKKVDYFIDCGPLENSSSTVIDLTKDDEEILRG
jgi:L-threonylcarbamoyladenylate synthase